MESFSSFGSKLFDYSLPELSLGCSVLEAFGSDGLGAELEVSVDEEVVYYLLSSVLGCSELETFG